MELRVRVLEFLAMPKARANRDHAEGVEEKNVLVCGTAFEMLGLRPLANMARK